MTKEPEDFESVLEKETALKVIKPKLQQIYQSENSSDEPIKSKSDFRERFVETFETSVSAVKFDRWCNLIGIKLRKVKMISGLEAASPARPSGRAVEGVDPLDDSEVFDNETPQDQNRRPMNVDAFRQM